LKPVVYLALAMLLPFSVEQRHVADVVTVALIVILFDGGRGMGLPRFRAEAVPILGLGLVGTFATAGAAMVAAHLLLGVSWYLSLLLATALAPTDPAVVFSLLGEIRGRSSTVLEGESGANDPVGIALLAALLGAGSLSGSALGHAAGDFGLQLAVGTAVGMAGGWLMRRLPLEFLLAFGLYWLAHAAHGSGFLAVFVAGLVAGDDVAHVIDGTIGEVVAFVGLGLLVVPSDLIRLDVWLPGLALAVLVGFVVRPLACWPFVLGLRRPERAFVLLAGLKGAVPLLLGSMLLGQQHGHRLFAVTVVVVVLSIVVQGALVPLLARRT